MEAPLLGQMMVRVETLELQAVTLAPHPAETPPVEIHLDLVRMVLQEEVQELEMEMEHLDLEIRTQVPVPVLAMVPVTVLATVLVMGQPVDLLELKAPQGTAVLVTIHPAPEAVTAEAVQELMLATAVKATVVPRPMATMETATASSSTLKTLTMVKASELEMRTAKMDRSLRTTQVDLILKPSGWTAQTTLLFTTKPFWRFGTPSQRQLPKRT